MSFSASTCVTNLGGIDINSTVKIRTYPGEIQIGGDIILSAMTGVNCPYTINDIPNGTTELQIYVPGTNVCGYIDISDNDLCNTCDLGFDSFTSTTIGNIIAGNLTGSCQNPITDYRILWFGPSESMEVVSTNVARISGKGSAFTYNYQHPLTGTSSLPMEQGYYKPVIDKVRINGVDFSYTGGTGYVPADLECFDTLPIYVSGYTCDNGTLTGDYTHRVNFESIGGSLAPTPLTSTFILSGGTTNFLAWKFKGYGIPDQLKLTFFGSEYNFEPIILEWWEVGGSLNYTSNIQRLDVFPKSAITTNYISKVTTLTGLTINDNDRILLEVIPSKTNYNTSWDFYFTCLETFSCESCLDNYENESYKIIGNQIVIITGSCDTVIFRIPITGCSESNFNTSDIYKYYTPENNRYVMLNQDFQFYKTPVLYSTNLMNFGLTSCNAGGGSSYGNCSSSGSYMSFTKDNTGSGGTGLIRMEFSGSSSLTNLSKFYNNYLFVNNLFSGSTNNVDLSYYRNLILRISDASGDVACGDSTGFYDYAFHNPTAVVTTGLTGSVYFLTITMPTITKGLFPSVCEIYCDSGVNSVINTINHSSTGSSNNRTVINNVGSSYQQPFYGYNRVTQSTNINTGFTQYGFFDINSNSLNTVPASGSSNTIIPSLSGQVCDYSSRGVFNANGGGIDNGRYTFDKYFFHHKIVLTNPLDVRDFDIYTSPINNFVYSGYPGTINYELAYSYSAGSVVYSSSTYVI